jgi:glutamate racemase
MQQVSPVGHLITERTAPKVHEAPPPAKNTPTSPIGMFDSGVGGLTVLKQVMRQLPNEDIIYLADTARVPFGGRSAQEIIRINHEIINYLLGIGVKLVIMACGTSSSLAYPIIKEHYHKLPLISLIEPGARAAVNASAKGKIGVIATQATINSHAFSLAITEIKKKAEVYEQACPLFVPLIEGGFIEAEETKRVAKEYLKPLLKAKIDTLILGCTHFPHLIKILGQITGPEVTFIDPAEEAASETKETLKKLGLLKGKSKPPVYQFFTTGPAPQFENIGSKLLGKPIPNVKQITLPELKRR